MNKKFLSAILFGALMVTSTGTFVSCKDYDDDIQNLQTQIDKNSSAIAELQKLVGQGKWVSSISSIENGFTVNMSDGSSHQIKGINGKDGADGKDGKNGTEWTIGEDGFWYVDGEKTENVAVAKDGKNGVTAPAPYINADGMWVVYTFDAEKGEFVAETTEISAQGTNAYAVKADGVYTLYIADENGELQEIALPATTDAFVAQSPAALVEVLHQEAKWKKVTGKEDKELFAQLAEVFPEIASYEKDQLMKQGGNLPVIISPANVELTNEFSYSLQNLKGEVSEAVISNPVKGMPEVDLVNQGLGMITRSANSNDCLWTLNVEPAKNKKGTAYVDITEPHTLVVENAKGTVVKTAFAYYLTSQTVGDVSIDINGFSVTNDEEIDVLAKVYEFNGNSEDKEAVFTIHNGMNGHYIVEVDELDAEKYGVTVDGSKINIANMPADKTFAWIKVRLIALGLNGSVAATDYVNLYVGQKIEATGELADKTVTLAAEDVKVRWNIEDLKFSAVQLDNFLNASKRIYVTYENEEGEEASKPYASVKAYDAKGNETTDYKKAVTFGFSISAANYEPRDYNVRLEAKLSGSTIYVAEGTLTVVNPTTEVIKIAEAFVDAEGVLQITGTPGAVITYEMAKAFVTKNATITGFEDLDADSDDITTSWIADGTNLVVDKYDYEDVEKQDLYKVRNFKVNYYLFGNEANTAEMEFQAEVISEIYSEDPTAVLTLASMSATFGDATDDKVADDVIDLSKLVTKAIYAAGTDKGKAYSLFATAGGKETVGATNPVYDYSAPKTASDLVLGTDGNLVTLSLVDYLKLCDAMNVTPDANIKAGKDTYKLTVNAWAKIWAVASKYYETSGEGKYAKKQNEEGEWVVKTDADGNKIWLASLTKDYAEADAAMMAMYSTLVGKISFTIATPANPGTSVDKPSNSRAREIAAVKIAFDEPGEAAKYFRNVATDGVVADITDDSTVKDLKLRSVADAPTDVVDGKVIVKLTMEVTCEWGMTMKVPFEVTVKTVK